MVQSIMINGKTRKGIRKLLLRSWSLLVWTLSPMSKVRNTYNMHKHKNLAVNLAKKISLKKCPSDMLYIPVRPLGLTEKARSRIKWAVYEDALQQYEKELRAMGGHYKIMMNFLNYSLSYRLTLKMNRGKKKNLVSGFSKVLGTMDIKVKDVDLAIRYGNHDYILIAEEGEDKLYKIEDYEPNHEHMVSVYQHLMD